MSVNLNHCACFVYMNRVFDVYVHYLSFSTSGLTCAGQMLELANMNFLVNSDIFGFIPFDQLWVFWTRSALHLPSPLHRCQRTDRGEDQLLTCLQAAETKNKMACKTAINFSLLRMQIINLKIPSLCPGTTGNLFYFICFVENSRWHPLKALTLNDLCLSL